MLAAKKQIKSIMLH